MESPEARVRRSYGTQPGSRFPIGATVVRGGVNFCTFCRHATHLELLLYASEESVEPFQVVTLTREANRTFFFWHVLVEDLPLRCCYTWRAYGPLGVPQMSDEAASRKELLDPHARGVSDRFYQRRQAAVAEAAEHASLRAIVTEPLGAPGQDVDVRTLDDAIIYELHVGGFTRHPSSGVRHPGTFAGLIEKIPYLQALGVTHVELLPVMAFDEQDIPASAVARGLSNYWGYSTHSFYSPHPRYCVEPARAPQEFREFVDALHAAGIRVLLDVVFNHTSEAGRDGPLIHFKVFANEAFYQVDNQVDTNDARHYRDYTGCGNTVNCNHPLVSAFIMRCLEYWVRDLGVDGFRFDLASVFARGAHGELLPTPPLPWAMEASPVLARVPLIAEAWDAGGLYHVGAFPGMAWAEWNGRYRDVIRRFVRGDPGLVGEVCTCIAGSADLYQDDGRLPANSINFVTCHDGFTLNDLVSYDAKHNEANGEDNRDGSNDNLSWNCGAEGESSDAAIIGLRLRQARNFMAILLLSQGVPMLLAGDEILRSQRGNNNAFCQDNALSWMDWRLSDDAQDMLRFVRELIALRKRHASLRRRRFLTGRPENGQTHPDVAWHGERLDEPAWHDRGARFVALTLAGHAPDEPMLHIVFNMNDDARDAALPVLDNRSWRRIVDTSAEAPRDIVPDIETADVERGVCRVEARSVVVLESF